MAPPRAAAPPARRRRAGRGHTYLELLVSTAILVILAAAALPVAEVAHRREVEQELRQALRDVRLALDAYHRACVVSARGMPAGAEPTTIIIKIEDDPDLTCFPKTLDVLVDGVETNVPRYALRFLRRIPRDPTNRQDHEHDAHGWRLVSTTDDPERSLSWDRRNVFDVRSASQRRALNGSRYEDW